MHRQKRAASRARLSRCLSTYFIHVAYRLDVFTRVPSISPNNKFTRGGYKRRIITEITLRLICNKMLSLSCAPQVCVYFIQRTSSSSKRVIFYRLFIFRRRAPLAKRFNNLNPLRMGVNRSSLPSASLLLLQFCLTPSRRFDVFSPFAAKRSRRSECFMGLVCCRR